MPRKRSTPPDQLSHRWYLREWAEKKGKIQADAIRELGWPKGTASELWNNKQRYTQDLVDQVLGWLDLQPHELFMPPEMADAMKQLRSTARLIAAEEPASYEPARAAPPLPARKKPAR